MNLLEKIEKVKSKGYSESVRKIKNTIVILVFIIVGMTFTYFAGNGDYDSHDTYTSSNSSGVSFRNPELLNEHYQKHGVSMGFSSAKDYEAAARSVVEDDNVLHKTEAEDGDDVYYLKSTNEFVIVSKDGYIRTYFKPDDGIDYYNRQ